MCFTTCFKVTSTRNSMELKMILYFFLVLFNFHPLGPLLPPANEVCEGYVFTGVCLFTWGVSVWGGLCPGGLCPGGLCPRGVSVQWGSVKGGLCPGVSVQGGICPGVSVMDTPHRLGAGGTHPTGMHSCFPCVCLLKCVIRRDYIPMTPCDI